MAKSPNLIRDRLAKVFDSKRMTKAEFLRRAGFSSSLLETYLKGDSVPGLEALDRIAAAIGDEPWTLIMPAGEDVVAKSAYEAILRENDELKEDLVAARRLLKSDTSPSWRKVIAAFPDLNEAQVNQAIGALRVIFDPIPLDDLQKIEVGTKGAPQKPQRKG